MNQLERLDRKSKPLTAKCTPKREQQKSVLLRLLIITSNNQRNKSSEKHLKFRSHRKISLDKKHWWKATLKENSTVSQLKNSEIAIPQPVLAHADNDEDKNSASRSNPSEIELTKPPEEWRKGTTLVTRDSMIAGLRKAKLSSNKKIKVRFFPGAKAEDLMFHLIPNLKKSPTTSLFILGRNE